MPVFALRQGAVRTAASRQSPRFFHYIRAGSTGNEAHCPSLPFDCILTFSAAYSASASQNQPKFRKRPSRRSSRVATWATPAFGTTMSTPPARQLSSSKARVTELGLVTSQAITLLDTGFSVGTNAVVNNAGDTYRYVAYE